METIQTPPSTAEFAIGSILSRSFSTLMKNPLVFVGMSLFALVPPAIIIGLMPEDMTVRISMQVVEMILGLVIQGAVAYAVFQTLRGNTASLGESISRGMGRIVPLFITALLATIGTAIGMVLLVIPAFILLCMWAVAIPACVVERLGATESLSRSAELTKGYRWKIFGLVLIATLLIIAAAGLMTAGILMVTDNLLVVSVVTSLIITVPQAFYYILFATVYYDLRAIKDGVSIDSLATVFD